MTLGGLQPTPAPATAQPAATAPVDKRAALQMALLQKSLKAQNQETIALSNSAQGKGSIIDIRV